MAEALSAGTPVLAFPRGAAPEIIEHGITGWLGRDEEELASVLRNSREFDRAACRASVERRLSVPRMARDHERLYERLVKRAARPGSAATAARSRPRGRPSPRSVRSAWSPRDRPEHDTSARPATPFGARASERQTFVMTCSGGRRGHDPRRPLR